MDVFTVRKDNDTVLLFIKGTSETNFYHTKQRQIKIFVYICNE